MLSLIHILTDSALEELMFPKDKSATNKRMPNFDYIRKELLRNGVNISSSSALSVMSKSSGHERLISAAFFKTLATVFLDTDVYKRQGLQFLLLMYPSLLTSSLQMNDYLSFSVANK